MKPFFSKPVSLSTYIFAWIAASGFLICLAWVAGAMILDSRSYQRDRMEDADRIAALLVKLSEESFTSNRWTETEKILNAVTESDSQILSSRVLDLTGAVVASCDRCPDILPASGSDHGAGAGIGGTHTMGSGPGEGFFVAREIRSPNSGRRIGTLEVRYSGKEFGTARKTRILGYAATFLVLTGIMLVVVRFSVKFAIIPGVRIMEQVRKATLSDEEISLRGTGITELDEMGRILEHSFRTLRRAQAMLEEHVRTRAMSEMAFGVAHDFNNYLAAIVANRESVERMLAESPVPVKKIRESLASIEKAALDAETLIRKVFLLGRHPEEEPEQALIRADSLVSEAVSILEGKWKSESARRGIRYAVRKQSEPLEMTGVPGDLRTALINLLANALDAMPSGGAVDVGALRTGDSVTFFVEDTGPGVEEGLREKIFEPFFTTKAPHGTGLGLAIVKRVAAAHGGTTSCLPRKDGARGTRFELTIPFLREGRPEAPRPPLPPDGETLHSRKILLVDDDELVLEAMANILQHLGQRVDLYSNGLEALAAFRDKRHPVVISDIGMTPINGFEVARRVKEIAPETTVILISGWSLEKDEVRRSGTVDHFLPKPFRLNDVREMLRNIPQRKG
ncbi:MAG: hypothetical protein A2X88_01260 [Deltaproteobacteria bacterium GWC2_65_14]|nr:MAG: hypothetical protein A2X88_01260 [Deltaproteobacteria bacterium GWC2_65_14]